jgi:hypothetical protein
MRDGLARRNTVRMYFRERKFCAEHDWAATISDQNLFDQFSEDIRQPEVAAGVAER